jgi:aminopeptidase YwaD
MKSLLRKFFVAGVCGVVFVHLGPGQVRERDIRAHMAFLAGDALRGRGSMTNDERIAAEYIASQLRQFNLEPAGDAGPDGQQGYVQAVPVASYSFSTSPQLTVPANSITWTHGQEMTVFRAGGFAIEGPLAFDSEGASPDARSIVFCRPNGPDDRSVMRRAITLSRSAKVGAVLLETPANLSEQAATLATKLPEFLSRDLGKPMVIFLSHAAAQRLGSVKPGAMVSISGESAGEKVEYSWNVLGVLPGTDETLKDQVISLSAHLDHLGVRPGAEKDSIYNGADDDASGTTAVLELARQLGQGPRPRRTVYVVLFGSEERGGFGAQHFLATMPFPLSALVADIQFEMIGRPDSAVSPDQLWLTGFERSNLGPELAQHGAKLVADPHPSHNFFQRSDNYAFAKMGVVAHTVSSYGLHEQYHQTDDDIAHIDFSHMTRSIQSMVAPIRWFVNSDFAPTWNPGLKP